MPSPLLADHLQTLAVGADWKLISSLLPAERPAQARRGRVPAHAHPHQEFMVAFSGKGLAGHGELAYPCPSGTVFFFDSFEPHDDGYSADTQTAEHLWISILGDRALATLVRVHNGKMTSNDSPLVFSAEDLGLDLQRSISDARAWAHSAPALARARLMGLVSTLMGYLAHVPLDNKPSLDATQMAIEAIKRHIEQTSGNGVTLDQMARIAGFSRFHFSRIFKRHMGMTVHQFIDVQRRVRCEQLRLQGCNHKKIGEALGFSCPAAFSRWWTNRGRALSHG